MGTHPRISLSSLSSIRQSLVDDIAMWRDLGVEKVGLISPKLEPVGWNAAASLIAEAGFRVSNVATTMEAATEALRFAADVGATSVYVTSGGGGSRTWEEAASAFCEVIAPHAALANDLGLRLAVEPTNPLRADRSFVYSLRDAVDLAHAAGIGVALDLYSCWYERGLEELVERNVDSLALVQICDYVIGTFDTGNRAVPGDGDIPLERLLRMLLDAGYDGDFDVEIIGPRIEEEGYAAANRRTLEYTSALLDRLGA